MSIRVERELAQLDDIFSHLESDATLTDLKALSKAKKKIEALKIDPEKLHVRREALKALDELVATFSHPGKEIARVKAIAHNLLLFSTAEVQKRPPIGLSLGLYFDIGAPDHNGAIHQRLLDAAVQKVPFITTRSLLSYKVDKEAGTHQVKLSLIKAKDEWDVFQKGEFLLFLPKSLHSTLSEEKKLQTLDFVQDGTLKKIPLYEAFREPNETPNLDDFIHLFNPEPKLQKLFYLAGHGNKETIASLNATEYQRFLKFLDHQKCQGLTISSCSSGGESSLASLPTENDHLSFPLIVRSIGDFPTRQQPGERNIKLYFEEMKKFAEQGDETLQHLRKALYAAERGVPKEASNLAKVYFPHSKDSPGGFRPLDEIGSGYSLTLTRVRAHKLLLSQTEPNGLLNYEITDRKFLEIHPLVTDIPLQFKGGDPQLLSMVPGNGHHFLSTILLSTQSPALFLKHSIKFHTEHKLKADKGFFIGKLFLKNDILEEVVLKVGPSSSYAVFRRQGKYFFVDGKFAKGISPLEHALFVEDVAKQTTPSKKGIRATSGGQESEKDFNDAIKSPLFCPHQSLAMRELVLSGKIKSEELTTQEVITFSFYLFRNGEGDLAFKLLKSREISPDAKSYEGAPLIYAAEQSGHHEAVLWLLERGAAVNFSYPRTSFILQVVASGDAAMVNLLLNHSDIEVEPINDSQSPIAFAPTQEIMELLKKRGASLNRVGKDGFTILSSLVNDHATKRIPFILSQGADPNAGSPSALTLACQGWDVELVQSFLEAGGSAYKKDAGGHVPAIEAVQKGAPQLVNILLTRKDFDPLIEDGFGLTLAMAGVISGHPEKIEALKKAGISLTEDLEKKHSSHLSETLSRLILLDDYSSVVRLIEWNGGKWSSFDRFVLSFVFLKTIKSGNTNSLKLALQYLGDNKKYLLKLFTSDQFWDILMKDHQMDNIKQILLHTRFRPEIVEKLWHHAKLEGNEHILNLLEKLGVQFRFGLVNGVEHLQLSRNEKNILSQPTSSIDQSNLLNSHKEKFIEFLYNKGLKRTVS